jgi:hypothetical protein
VIVLPSARLLLAFGIVAGAELVGLPSEAVVHDASFTVLGSWAPWLGGLGGVTAFRAIRR